MLNSKKNEAKRKKSYPPVHKFCVHTHAMHATCQARWYGTRLLPNTLCSISLTVTLTPQAPSWSVATFCTTPLPKDWVPTTGARPLSCKAAVSTSAALAVFPSTTTTKGTCERGECRDCEENKEEKIKKRAFIKDGLLIYCESNKQGNTRYSK